MKLFAPVIAAAALTALPLAAAAEVELSYGIQANAMLPEGGSAYYTGEGYIEAAVNSFTFGLWIGSLDADPADEFEIELSAGYAFEFGNDMELALTYAKYLLNKTGDNGQDINAELSFPISGAFSGLVGTSYDIDGDAWDVYADAIYTMDKFELAAEFGNDGANYWSLTGTYSITDNTWVSAEYADAEASPYEITLSVGYDF